MFRNEHLEQAVFLDFFKTTQGHAVVFLPTSFILWELVFIYEISAQTNDKITHRVGAQNPLETDHTQVKGAKMHV